MPTRCTEAARYSRIRCSPEGLQADRIVGLYVWARAGAAVKTVAIVKIAKAGMCMVRAQNAFCIASSVPV
jgi:hypothetical protein